MRTWQENRAFARLLLVIVVLIGLALIFGLPYIPVASGQQHPAVVRVAVQQSDGTFYGSGAIVGRADGWASVLTAAHNLRGDGKVSVWAVGRWFDAEVKQRDPVWDVAVVGMADPGISPIPLATVQPVRGDRLCVVGFGQGDYRAQWGHFSQMVAPGRRLPFDWIEMVGGSRQGDSGGPILNQRGKLVAMCSTTNSVCTQGACFPRIRRIIRPPKARAMAAPKRRPVVPIKPPPALAVPNGELDNVPLLPPQPPAVASVIEPLRTRVAALEAILGDLRAKYRPQQGFTAQIVDSRGRIIETLEVLPGGILPLRFQAIPKKRK